MSKCKFCGKKKAYTVTEIDANKATTVLDLCEGCFAKYIQDKPKPEGMKVPVPIKSNPTPPVPVHIDPKAADKFVEEMMHFVEDVVNKTLGSKSRIKPPCPKCKASLKDIAKMGKLGCPYCYEWYADELQNTLRVSHWTPNSPEQIVHTGKVPKNYKKPEPKPNKEETDKMRLIKLQYKLTQAVEREDYETAAKLRDIIKDLIKLQEKP